MKPAEALLPDTDAITNSTVEIRPYRGKTLVRYRDPRGYTHRLITANSAEANAQFQEWVNQLRRETQGQNPWPSTKPAADGA